MIFNLISLIYISLLCSSIFMIITRNPVYSVFCLIMIFLNFAILLILHNFDFLGIILFLVYVGAIAILFLFIIMMINMKKIENGNIIYMILSFILSISIFFYITYILWSLNLFYLPKELSTNANTYTFINYFFINDIYNNINLFSKIGYFLFNQYYLCIFFSGILLLISIMGSIFLINYKKGYSKRMQSNQFFRLHNILNSHLY